MLPILPFPRHLNNECKKFNHKHSLDDPLDGEEWQGLLWIVDLWIAVCRRRDDRKITD